ncbi:hypothetical protein F5Y14DRAFT_466260 [Nemania sp. NC0429]|nr:hypothetical protein F5Y14DRAFT_466259 [Nemania sp. NC0429]KAI1109900.1 hypothetical protein F5Y14DRAFT_466260 [Nemania sp. NC0429]
MAPTMTPGARENYLAAVVFIPITAIVLILRFASKIWFRQAPQGPDWLCLLATAFLYTLSGLIINFITKHGVYTAGPPLTPDETTELLKDSWVEELLFGAVLTSVKLSILWFYYTIFSVDRTFRRSIIIAAAICIVWFIVAEFVIIFQCHPVKAFWTTSLFSNSCLDTTKVLFGYELTNFFIDVLILCIPISAVRKLQMSKWKRIAVTGVFLMGGLVCVASIARIAVIWRLPDPVAKFDYATVLLLGNIQDGLAVTCASLITLGPIMSVLFHACSRSRERRREKKGPQLSDDIAAPQADHIRQEPAHNRVSASSQKSGGVVMSSPMPIKPLYGSYDEEKGRET